MWVNSDFLRGQSYVLSEKGRSRGEGGGNRTRFRRANKVAVSSRLIVLLSALSRARSRKPAPITRLYNVRTQWVLPELLGIGCACIGVIVYRR